jgi:hypothetical protein
LSADSPTASCSAVRISLSLKISRSNRPEPAVTLPPLFLHRFLQFVNGNRQRHVLWWLRIVVALKAESSMLPRAFDRGFEKW